MEHRSRVRKGLRERSRSRSSFSVDFLGKISKKLNEGKGDGISKKEEFLRILTL
jgi:hypothetical protein